MPTFLRYLNTMPRIDSAIQQGRGVVGSVLGQPYDVRRLSSTTNVSISANPPVLSQFPSRVRRTTSRYAIEDQVFDLLVYEAKCDNRLLHIGDTCTETGYGHDSSVFSVVQKRPTRETLWIQTPFNVFITRPIGTAGNASQQPASGAVASPGYAGTTKAGEEILTLKSGLYSFSSVPGAIQAGVQAGLQLTRKLRDAKEPKIPTALYREDFLIYLPLLPGEQIVELDRVNFGNGDRYEVAAILSTDTTGINGYVIVGEKMAN